MSLALKLEGKILAFLLFLTITCGWAQPGVDTLFIADDLTSYTPQTIFATETDQLDIGNLASYDFTQLDNQVSTSSNFIIQQKIHLRSNQPMDIIVEPKGFHYVDVILKNLTNGEIIIKKGGRLLGSPENELSETSSTTNKLLVTLNPGITYQMLIFYKNPKKETIDINLRLIEMETWLDEQNDENHSISFWLGIFFGTLLLLSLINYIFYYLFKDGTYIVYVGYIITIAIYEGSVYGYLDKLIFNHFPLPYFIVNNISLFLFIIFYLLFLQKFLNLKVSYPKWNTVVYFCILYLGLVLLATTVIILSGRPIGGFYYRNLGLLFAIVVGIAFLSSVVFSKRLIDRVFFAGSISLVLSGLISVISTLIGKYGNSDMYLQIGIIIELVIFNIGLGLRSKIIQNEKDAELIRLNTSLEEKVIKRTQEINNINQELTKQRDKLYKQNETIEQNLNELGAIRKSLEVTVDQKTKALRQANKELVAQNAQLEQYGFITAHNLKAPVARLKGLINIFELTNPTDNPNDDIVKRIKEASLDMEEVISDINKILQIKNFSKQKRQEIKLVPVIDKISKRLETKAKQNNVGIKIDLQIKNIHSIDTYLESILYNLIFNGIKYAREDVDSMVEIQTYNRLTKTIIKVKDNGVGIDLEKYGDKIFGLYQRFHDHVNGKGIGLYLVKTQVEALNGKISIASNVDEGTEFKISFPAAS